MPRKTPADATLRNVKAANRKFVALARRVAKLEAEMSRNKPLLDKLKKLLS